MYAQSHSNPHSLYYLGVTLCLRMHLPAGVCVCVGGGGGWKIEENWGFNMQIINNIHVYICVCKGKLRHLHGFHKSISLYTGVI